MLEVVNYIRRNGLEKLKKEFNIQINYYEDRIVLNYNQVDSSNLRFHPIVKECRALILKYNPNKDHTQQDFRVLCRSFDRFFNVGEDPNDLYFNYDKAVIQEKLDGSLMNIYHDGNIWCVSTRKMAFAEGLMVTGKYTFEESFLSTYEYMTSNKLQEVFNIYGSKGYTYITEYTSPMNRIVTPYKESCITLLDCRNNFTGEYNTFSSLRVIGNRLGLPVTKEFVLNTLEDIHKTFDETSNTFEGYVAVIKDENHRRIKIKNPSYLILHRMRGTGVLTPKSIIKLIMENETSEWLSTFPEDTNIIQEYIDIKDRIINDIEQDFKLWKDIKEQKDFALRVNERPYAGILFNMRKEYKPPYELLEKMTENYLVKLFEDYKDNGDT